MFQIDAVAEHGQIGYVTKRTFQYSRNVVACMVHVTMLRSCIVVVCMSPDAFVVDAGELEEALVSIRVSRIG